MKAIVLFITIMVYPLLSVTCYHEYYVSVTEMTYAKEKKSLQIISQIFIDDFENVLRERYDENIILALKQEPQTIEMYMSRYLEDKLKVKINGVSYNFNFIGKEYQDDIVYCYLEIENIERITSIEVTNKILYDVIPKQQNILRLKINNKNKSFLLVEGNDNCMLNFD
jgi:hypothetical protein